MSLTQKNIFNWNLGSDFWCLTFDLLYNSYTIENRSNKYCQKYEENDWKLKYDDYYYLFIPIVNFNAYSNMPNYKYHL